MLGQHISIKKKDNTIACKIKSCVSCLCTTVLVCFVNIINQIINIQFLYHFCSGIRAAIIDDNRLDATFIILVR